MARLLVVSRSMALAMRIADDHEVVEHPVERLEKLAPGKEVEAVVLDLGEPLAAMQTLDRLREGGFATPVLIVSGYQPAWKDLVDLSIERVVVVPLPITRAALLDGIDRLLGLAPASPPRSPATAAAAAPAPAAVPAASGGAPRRAPEPASAAAAAPAGDAGDDEANGDTRKRGGLSRFLHGSGPRPGLADGSTEVEQPPVRNGSPLAPPTGPAARAEPEQDLFRPVVEPPVPVRSPSARPRAPISAAPAPTPAPTPAPAPARPASPTRTPVPSTPPSASAAPTASPTARASAPPSAPPAAPAPPPEVGERPAQRPLSLRGRPASPAPETARGRAEPAPARGRAEPEPAPVERRPAAAPAPAPALAPSEDRSPFPPRGRDRGQKRGGERHPGFTPGAGIRTAPGLEPRDEVAAAVRALLDRRGELFGVTETAQVLADEVVERGESDAAAVLVPDGTRWRVSGGVGLRPLERRLLLDPSHWLISEIALGGRALLIEDTDIVRPRLAGAPLAAWRHLLAVPVPGMRAAVVLARGQEAARFTERDLGAVVPVVAEAGPLLAAALQMRDLARALAPLRDVDK